MLSESDKKFYDDNGYLHVKGLFTPEEAAIYRKECHDLADRLQKVRNIDATWGSAREGAAPGKAISLLHSHDVQLHSAVLTKMMLDERFTSIAAGIIGPNVQLHHTKMFIKPPEKGSPFPLHQDAPFFPHDKHSMIAAIIHFDDAPLEKGCVCVIPGSHKLGPLEHIAEGSWHLPTDQYPISKAAPLPAKAGDALFFSYLTIHGSGINESSEARTTVLVQMRDPEDRPCANVHESACQGMMLTGIDPTTNNHPGGVPKRTESAAMGMGMGMGSMSGAMK